MNSVRVLMIGPARSVKGGMTSVVDNYYKCGLDQKIDLKYIETINDKSKVSKYIKEKIGMIQFKKAIKNYDIVHIHMASRRSTFRKMKYIRLAKKYGKKVVVHIHGAEYKEFYANCSEEKKVAIKDTLNMCDRIVVLSEEWKEYFSNILDKEKIIVLYNGIVLPENFDKDLSTNNILFLGRIGERKGIFDLLNVFRKIVDKYPNIKLFVGGDGESDKLVKIIADNHLENNVFYVGWTSGEEKERLLKECTFYVLPSYNEGMPMAIIEAMAYKNVTISTTVGGIPKMIDNNYNGVLVNPGNREELYNALVNLIGDDEIKRTISGNARITVEEKFNIEKNIIKLIEIYNCL